MNQKVHNQIVSFIWSIADDVLRDVFVRGKYRDIILPFTVLRRLDALLVPTKDKVLEADKFMRKEKIDDKSALQKVTGYPFWNISKFTFDKLLNDSDNIDSNLETYLDGFSPNVQEIISKFKLRNQLETMKDAGITYLLIEKLCNKEINLSPNEAKNSRGEILPPLTNLGMGYVFEELIRKFNEENNEEAGEHFTPREIIKLMTHILFLPVKDKIKKGTYLIYDPACGSGGMLTEAEHFALEITNSKANFELYGQEVNPETYAICTSDMLIKGENANNIKYGSTLSKDGFGHLQFDFMLSNPPYGKTWKIDEDAIVDDRGKKGKEKIKDPRFQIGLPVISDGQLLFLMNMVKKMKLNTELGSRIASVHNGSSLFTGDAGSGESEIRRYLIENDYVETIIQLPNNLFYNTGILTFIWILSSRKSVERKGKIQLIDASDTYSKMRKPLGNKSNEFKETHIEIITRSYLEFKEDSNSKLFANSDFGYWSITVERPLRLSFQISEERISNIRSVGNLKRLITELQKEFGSETHSNFNLLNEHIKKLENSFKISAKEKKVLLDTICWKDENAEPVVKQIVKGKIEFEPDADLRDYEKIPLKENIAEFFQREVLTTFPDSWIDDSKTIKGYEISFAKYFHKQKKIRGVEEVISNLFQLEEETKAIINSAVSKGINRNVELKASGIAWLGNIPKHWDIKKNKHLFRKTKNLVGSKSASYQVLSLSTKGVIPRNIENNFGKMPATFDDYQIVKPDTLLMCLFDIDVTPRCVGYVKQEGIVSPAYTSLESISSKVFIEYFYYWYLMLDFDKKLLQLSRNLRSSVGIEEFLSIPTPVPPFDEQVKIVEYIKQETDLFDQAIQRVEKEIELLKEYKISLITETVSGRINVHQNELVKIQR